jgi:hypothetical protein
MGPHEKELLVNHFQKDEPSVVPAVLSCAAGIVGLVMVAASPWLVLSASPGSLAAEPPVAQVASASPAVEESKRIFDERRQRFEASRQGGTQGAAASLAAGPQEPR